MSGGEQVRGEKNGRHVLTEEQVRSILSAYKSGRLKMAWIARDFGVSEGTIRNIIHGRTWSHLNG